MRGFVYVMVNDHIPSLVKIGYTDRDPEIRATELSSTTGVPGKFEVMYFAYLDNPQDIERLVHSNLIALRKDKEFFAVTLDSAIAAIRAAKADPIFEGLSERAARLFPGLAAKPTPEVVNLKNELDRVTRELEASNLKLQNAIQAKRRSKRQKRGY